MPAIEAARQNNTTSRRRLILMVFVYVAAIVAASTVMAQPKKDKEKPKPRPVTLKTKDGIKLRAFYFPSDQGKKAIPVLLVHEWQGQASPYVKLVVALNNMGCAVLVPDYRGHGGSNEYTDFRGVTKEFNLAQMSKRDVENIIAFDLEKAKAFLKEENNAGMLNLNALVIIGIREGCVMGSHWTQRDWNFPSLGSVKQGQDVKALVFISPNKQIKGIGIDPTLSDRGSIVRLPMLIIAGDESPEAEEAERIGKRVESIKKRFGQGEARGFELNLPKTKLSGSALINETDSVIPAITEFIKSQVRISDEENPWIERD